MALARFNLLKPDFQPITRKFGAPKKMTMEAWFRAARKIIPEIPDVSKTDWQIYNEHATADAHFITYELANSVGEKATLIIDRKIPLIG